MWPQLAAMADLVLSIGFMLCTVDYVLWVCMRRVERKRRRSGVTTHCSTVPISVASRGGERSGEEDGNWEFPVDD